MEIEWHQSTFFGENKTNLIKYNTPTSYKMHINQIKSDIINFISKLKFDNNAIRGVAVFLS